MTNKPDVFQPRYRFVSAAVKNILEKQMYPDIVEECKKEILKRNNDIKEFLETETNPDEIALAKSKLVHPREVNNMANKKAREAIELYCRKDNDRHFSKENRNIIRFYSKKILNKEESQLADIHRNHGWEEHEQGWEKMYEDLEAFSDALKYGLKLSPEGKRR